MANSDTFWSDVEPFIDGLQAAALRNTRHRQDAEDLVQETLLRAFRGYSSFEEGTNLRAWLNKILTNQHINVYRKKQRSVEEVDLADADSMWEYRNVSSDHYRSTQSAEDTALAGPVDDKLDEGLASLPEHFLEPIWLVDVLRMSYAQAATELNVPIGTIMSRLHRGRTQLQDWLEVHVLHDVL